jgi:hypothetical protein
MLSGFRQPNEHGVYRKSSSTGTIRAYCTCRLGIPIAVAAMSVAASQSQASQETVDERARSSFESLLSGDIHAYSTGRHREVVYAYRAKRIKVNRVSIDCDGLAMAIEVWRPKDVHFTYSLTMPLAVKLATGGQNEFMAKCDIPDCVKTKLSVTTPNGEMAEEDTASFLQVITAIDKGSHATQAFRKVRASCAGTAE